MSSPVEEFADYWDWFAVAEREGWTDGLPLAPPTEDRVLSILRYLGRKPTEVVGVVPPAMGVVTIEQLAIQCAMAACEPQHVPVVIAALQAMLEPEFSLHGVQSTSNPCTPLVVVSGPVVQRLRFNSGEGAFGGGSRANAAVGRAIRLLLQNIGGAVAGKADMATQGTPAKYAFCVAENPASPWPPIHCDFGFEATQSCVTVFACVGPEAIFSPGTARRILRILASTLPTTGVNMMHAAGQFMIALSLRPATELARAGYGKKRLKKWIFDNARYDLGTLRRSRVLVSGESLMDYWGGADTRPDLRLMPDSAKLPMVHRPDDIHVLVAGGDSQWWMSLLPGWGDYGGSAVCREVNFPGGS